MAAQKEEVLLKKEDFISKNHEMILKKYDLELQIKNDGGIYKPFIRTSKEMDDVTISNNLKKALIEISNKFVGPSETKQFNMLMSTLIENADNDTIQKVKSADQNYLKTKFIETLKNAEVKLGDITKKKESKGSKSSEQEDMRSVSLISKKEFEQWLVEKKITEMKSEGKKATHENAKEAFGKILTEQVKNKKSLTSEIKDEQGTIIATTLATGAKGNEELQKKDVKGVVAIIRDDNVEKQILDGSKKVSDELYEKIKINEKDKTKFGSFKDKDGNIIARMKHANGKWKDSVLADNEGKLNEETLKELCYVANIYEKDTSTKSREKNNISQGESKEIRKIITDYVFSIPGVEEAYKQADEKYKKDRPGYELSRDGFAAGYLYEILRQNKK